MRILGWKYCLFAAVPLFAIMADVGTSSGPVIVVAKSTMIDMPQSTNGTKAYGINNNGEVVGYYWDDAGRGHGFLHIKQSFVAIDPPGASGELGGTFATDINDGGQVVGYFTRSVGGDHGFLLTSGVYQTIDYPTANETFVYGINNAVDIVGSYDDSKSYVDGLPRRRGFLMSKHHFATIDVPDSVETEARGINQSGQIVGYFTDEKKHEHAFLLNRGVFKLLNFGRGATDTRALAINTNGDVVGNYSDKNGLHWFIWTKGSFATIPTPVDTKDTDAEVGDLNDKEQFVSAIFKKDMDEHGVLMTLSYPHSP